MMRKLLLALAALFAQPALATKDMGPTQPGHFDYYVLSLTWAPEFCAAHADPQECGKGLGFVVHGLWPEYDNGDYPSGCAGAALTPWQGGQVAGLYPDPALAAHEWAKHGTCSGLSPEAYFGTVRTARGLVTIPDQFDVVQRIGARQAGAVEEAFVIANPGLASDDIQVGVWHGWVTDVAICFTKTGAFRGCKPG